MYFQNEFSVWLTAKVFAELVLQVEAKPKGNTLEAELHNINYNKTKYIKQRTHIFYEDFMAAWLLSNYVN